jgi:hypothetical protein
MALVLGMAYVALDRTLPAAPALHGAALSDDQSVDQVVQAARQVVAAAQLRSATGGYTFMACGAGTKPPYQAALYMTFALPQDNSARYLDDVAAAMVESGWTDTAAGEHFGHKLSRDGLSALLNRSSDDRAFATIRLYGECRNMSDHHDDNPAWTEVPL